MSDPNGPDAGFIRVFRGGGWDDYGQGCRAAIRLWNDPSYQYSDLGFRVVLVQVP